MGCCAQDGIYGEFVALCLLPTSMVNLLSFAGCMGFALFLACLQGKLLGMQIQCVSGSREPRFLLLAILKCFKWRDPVDTSEGWAEDGCTTGRGGVRPGMELCRMP